MSKRGITNHGALVEIIGPDPDYPGFLRVRQFEMLRGMISIVRAEDVTPEPEELNEKW